MEHITVPAPEPTTKLSARASTLVKTATDMSVSTRLEHKAGLEAVRDLKHYEREVTDHFEPSRKALDLAKREILKARDDLIAPAQVARKIIAGKCLDYERAEEERARKLVELEARKEREEEERRIAEAEAIEEAGGTREQVDAALESEPEAPKLAPRPQTAKVRGVSKMTTWHAEVVDLQALVKYVASSGRLQLLEPNMTMLNGLAKTLKTADIGVPGVKGASTTTSVVR